MKTSELTGAALDWAVAKCTGQENCWMHDYKLGYPVSISTDWSQGGPIIEREAMHVDCLRKPDQYREAVWEAWPYASTKFIAQGPTPLIAAMRCYVASKLGDDVDVPDELI